MAIKDLTKPEVHSNGPSSASDFGSSSAADSRHRGGQSAETTGRQSEEKGTAEPSPGGGQVAMSAFQQRYARKLVANFERARAAVDAAQNAANEFIAACAEDQGISVGQDGWTFDVDRLEFVRIPPPRQEA